MDLMIVLAVVSAIIIIVLFTFLFRQNRVDLSDEAQAAGEDVGRGQPRNARARLRAAAAQRAQEREDGDVDVLGDHGKVGAKKLAKLEAKAEKKAAREAEEREREERRKRREAEEEERKKGEEREAEAEAAREAAAKRAEEERERQEHEAYLKMKAAFTVDQEGFDELDTDPDTLLQDFIQHIKDNKVVGLEQLAATFRLKTQAVIDRIRQLQADGRLTGVMDDRGKFIYISEKELEAVAKFVKQRGRVSITELAQSSQRLINLTPTLH